MKLPAQSLPILRDGSYIRQASIEVTSSAGVTPADFWKAYTAAPCNAANVIGPGGGHHYASRGNACNAPGANFYRHYRTIPGVGHIKGGCNGCNALPPQQITGMFNL